MARISEETINEIIRKTDIVDLIGEKVTLSKQGKSYFGLCPFHNEKTASFSVEPERKIYNCFSCGEKGNPITFLQKTENMTFIEAIESLSHRANMNLDFNQYKQENPHTRLYNINSEALSFYKLFLSNTKQGTIAKEYLDNRSITEDIINTFDLGLAPTEFDLLTKTLTGRGILVSDLHDLGLSKQSKKETFYDLFRSRIIIPIKDERGNVVAFSGRTYLPNDDSGAKYINSPQTKIFTKSNVLYNMNNALNAIKQFNRVVLFEGYMDVIAAHRSGVKESVASMGTSLTRDQVRLIKKYTSNVVICYDGDNAGIEATARAMHLFRSEQMEVKIVMLPDKMDPDDYIVKYSTDKLNHFINEEWIDGIEFMYRAEKAEANFSKMLDIEKFKKNVFDLIKNSSHSIIELYISKISNDVKISVESIRQDFEQYTKKHVASFTRKPSTRLSIDSKFDIAERRILNYFIKDFRYLKDFNAHDDLELLFIDHRFRDIKMVIEDMYFAIPDDQEKVIELEEFITLLTPDLKDFFESKVKLKRVDLDDQEYKDCRDVLMGYKKVVDNKNKQEQIEQALTVEEKIKLAVERDKKNKEDNKWTRKK